MSRNRNSESGYALLLIFAMAAVVAITLYKEVPRVAFEAQRDKEQLLVDRGQEYQRAVTLFVHKYNRFPGSMDELENTNRERYLRRKFVDPMTGKADWRLLHAGPGGVITDSVTTKKGPDGTVAIGTPNDSSANAMNTDGVNLATRRRPTDGSDSGAGGATSADGSPVPTNGLAGYNGPVMVLPDGSIVPANVSGAAPPPVGASGRAGGSPLPGMGPGGIPGQASLSRQPPLPGGVAVQQGNTGIPGVGNPPTSAANMINQILMSPRPGGMNGLPGGGAGAATPPAAATANVPTGGIGGGQQAQVIGAGIAGVASTKEQAGIKTINDRSKYNEWEFVYDITKDPARAGGRGAQGATGPQNNMGGPPGRGGPTPGPTTPPMMMPGGRAPGR